VIVIEVIVLLVALVVAARSRPPQRHVAPRVMSLLAAVALLAFGIAMGSIVIVSSERVFGIALLFAGVAGCAFLYLARGWVDEDDDDDGDEPPAEDPQGGDDASRRFARKRTRAPKAPAPR
jgi:hypothetical protein